MKMSNSHALGDLCKSACTNAAALASMIFVLQTSTKDERRQTSTGHTANCLPAIDKEDDKA